LIENLSSRLTNAQSDLVDSKELGQLRQAQLAGVRKEVEDLKFVQV
jgi:hypothetical protein